MRVGKSFLALSLVVAVPLTALAWGCGVRDTGTTGGSVQLHAQHSGSDDVNGFNFSIACSNGWHLNPDPTYVAIHGGAPSSHDFTDLFSTIPAPAVCTVTVTPMRDEKTPSADCAPITQQFQVLPTKTVELSLMIQCADPGNGGVDINPGTNHPPNIIIAISDKFPCVDQKTEIYVSTSDPDGDTVTLSYIVGTWTVTGGTGTCTPPPPSASYAVAGAPGGYPWYFSAQVAGEFCMTVTADDGHGGFAEMSFPIHVQDCKCCEIEKPDGSFVYFYDISVEDCRKQGGHIVTDDRCACCHDEKDRTYLTLLDPSECRPQPPHYIVEAELCGRVCCDYLSGQLHYQAFMTLGECNDLLGQIIPDEKCKEVPIRFCCRTKDSAGNYVFTWTADCKGGDIVPDDMCRQDICCERLVKDPHNPDVTYPIFAITSAVFCSSVNGFQVAAEKCIPQVCCAKDTDYFLTTADLCTGGLIIVPLEKCKRECCWFAQYGLYLDVVAGDCTAMGGTVAADSKCTGTP
jgi:hypothetical protein